MHRKETDLLDLGDERPSKTRRKEEMHALQDLGAALVQLSRSQLKRINLPEDILGAVLDWQRFPKHEAQRRQLQYIGKLMRNADTEPIEAGLALLRGESAAENARLHKRERLRERLMADEKALTEIIETWPQADLTRLRQLRRNAIKEQEASKPPKSFRLIFQYLKELESGVEAPEEESGDDGDE